VQRNSALDAREGGTRVRVPFFDKINPTEEVITSGNTWGTSGAGYLTSQNVTAAEQIMTVLHRGFQYATDDLSKLGSGADPLSHVRDQLAAAINKLKTATLNAQLSGLFGNIAGSGVLGANTVNKTGTTTATAANYLTAANVVAAKQVLGERGYELSGIAMHSNVAAYLEETGYLQVQSAGGSVYAGGGVGAGLGSGQVGRFAGLNVVIDDQIGVIAGGTATHLNKYPVYLFGSGCIGEGMQQDLRVEVDRNKSSFKDLLGTTTMVSTSVEPSGTPTATTPPTPLVPATWLPPALGAWPTTAPRTCPWCVCSSIHPMTPAFMPEP